MTSPATHSVKAALTGRVRLFSLLKNRSLPPGNRVDISQIPANRSALQDWAINLKQKRVNALPVLVGDLHRLTAFPLNG